MQNKKETMLEAFCRQHNIVPGSQDQTYEAEMKSILNDKALGLANLERALRENPFGRSADLRAAGLSVPTQLKDGDIDQKSVSHSNMSKYDHSLEMNRWKGNSLGEDEDIIMGDLTSEDI